MYSELLSSVFANIFLMNYQGFVAGAVLNVALTKRASFGQVRRTFTAFIAASDIGFCAGSGLR